MNGIQQTVDGIWRIESAKLIAVLTRLMGDVGLAEDLAQEALLTALERWPETGIPDHPGAWLLTTARNRGLDILRRERRGDEKYRELGYDLADRPEESLRRLDDLVDGEVEDDLLRLMFISCHPVLAPDARVALTLRLLGGLTTEEIARGFLVPAPTIGQRIVRAKRTLREARVPFESPRGEARDARIASVLEVLYLIFNEGYSATAGDDWVRPALCEDAMRLGRILAELAPQHPEIHGLVALMELQASRLKARVDATGAPILLQDQDRGRWDRTLIQHGLGSLERAEMGGPLGPYTLQAAIVACHARAATVEDTDWTRITALYDALAQLQPSPVVELNRAVAYGMAFGPAAGLEIASPLRHDPALAGYHLLPAVIGDLLARLGRREEARGEFERAAKLAGNERERTMLLARIAAMST